jgi:acyl-CoA thioester hydrolase
MNKHYSILARHRLRVRYGETDQMGVVYHPNYLIWFNESRDALLAGIGIDIAGIERRGYRFPIVEVGCRYLQSARYGDEIEISAVLHYQRVARMNFSFEVRHQTSHRLLATGESVSVVTNANGKLMISLPSDLQHAIEQTLQRQQEINEHLIKDNQS